VAKGVPPARHARERGVHHAEGHSAFATNAERGETQHAATDPGSVQPARGELNAHLAISRKEFIAIEHTA